MLQLKTKNDMIYRLLMKCGIRSLDRWLHAVWSVIASSDHEANRPSCNLVMSFEYHLCKINLIASTVYNEPFAPFTVYYVHVHAVFTIEAEDILS